MDLNSIINNDNISIKMKDIYKFIDKNEDKFNEIFNRTFDDIKNIFPNVTITNDIIEISNIEDSFGNTRDECFKILSHHSKNILGENSYLMSYGFKINGLKDTISIVKKH